MLLFFAGKSWGPKINITGLFRMRRDRCPFSLDLLVRPLDLEGL